MSRILLMDKAAEKYSKHKDKELRYTFAQVAIKLGLSSRYFISLYHKIVILY